MRVWLSLYIVLVHNVIMKIAIMVKIISAQIAAIIGIIQAVIISNNSFEKTIVNMMVTVLVKIMFDVNELIFH